MSLQIGQQLGSYEITSLLGKGGMGEVYRARDSKLKREVAIKVLPNEFSQDTERLSRFQREAEIVAALNHANVGTIYDIQEQNGTRFLVLELVEGETLADRIKSGPIPINESLQIAKQICEALEAAHEKGIIHRDLKPANVKITPDGKVKVLDFGLAKAIELSPANAALSDSPTLMSGSTPGIILGTAAYMSPEQARGREVDKRTDIWSFGCVLYEFLTGQWVFQSRDVGTNGEGAVVAADTVQDIVAKVLRAEPDWTALPETTPPMIRSLLRRCLQKDISQRSRDAGEIRLQIEETIAAFTSTLPPAAAVAVPTQPLWRHAWPPILTGLIVAAIVAGIALWNRPEPAPRPVSRTVIALPAGERLAGFEQPAIAFSPDGTQLAYVASDSSGTQRLYLRAMDSLQVKPFPGTEGASGPFFSPDGQWIGFFAVDALKKVSVSGGATLPLVIGAGIPRGASWGPDDTIVESPTGGPAALGLFRVSASGGSFLQLTSLKEGEGSHRWPQFLPGGKAILFTIATTNGNPDDWQIVALRIDTGERKILVQGGTDGRYVPTGPSAGLRAGHLIYYRAGSLMGVPFDPTRLEVTGTPAPILEGIMSSSGTTGAGQYSFSKSGSLVYMPGAFQQGQADRILVWIDRNGNSQPLTATPRRFGQPVLSPDGRVAAMTIGNDIWFYDIARDTLTRVTFEGRNSNPSWTPDGKRVAYNSSRNGADGIFWRLADGSGPEEMLFTGPGLPRTAQFTPDGRAFLFTQAGGPKTFNDFWVLPLDGGADTRKPRVFLQTPSNEITPFLSPDGRWVAYISNESGRYEVYVRPFPGPGGKWQISTEGGIGPGWSPMGNELFYRTGPAYEKMMAVDIQTQPTFSVGKPRLLFEVPRDSVGNAGGFGRDYSVSPDGQRFLVRAQKQQPQAAATQINVVTNWFEELKRLVPSK